MKQINFFFALVFFLIGSVCYAEGELTVGDTFVKQINLANNEGTNVGSLSLYFTVTSTDEGNSTVALYRPLSSGYSAENILKSGANAVSSNGLTGDGTLIIPETVTDLSGKIYTVTVIGASAFGEYATSIYHNITGLKIPSTITHIGVQAFRYLQYLSGNLIIPASVCQIGHPDVQKADLFYQDEYGDVKVPGVYMMHTSSSGIDWYETQAYYYFAYDYTGTNTTLNVCQEIYDKAYGYNGATIYPSTSAFWSWHYSRNWYGNSNQVKLFDPTKLGLKWNTEQTVVDISGEYEAPELENPFGLPVTYSSSHPSVADIDAETGEITLGTAEGSTTLTATFAGNEEYTTEVSVQTVIIRRGEPMLAEDQENHNEFNTCEALTKVTRWTPNPELYMENNMWEMPHMMDGKFYVSAFWQSNNYYDWCEWFSYDNEKFLQLTCSPAYLSPNYGWYYDDDGTNGFSHDQQPGSTLGGFICFKVKGSGTIIVRGFTVSDNAKMGICVQGNVAKLFSGGNEDTEITYNYTLENADDEAYAYVYGVSLLPGSRQGYIKYIKFIPDGTVMADVSVGGVAIEEESDDVLGDGGSVGFEWREDEDGGGEDPEADVKRFVGLDDIEGDGEEGDEPASSTRYPVLILNNANLTSENGPAIEVNSHDRFLIELRGQNTIKSLNGNAAISMGTLQSEDWGGGTISIVGLEEGASLTIPAVENVENGIYLAESSIKVENFSGDLSGTNCGIRFQGYDSSDWENDANCNMRFGKGISLKMRGGEEALTGFNPQSMYDPGYYDEEEDQWVYYALLGADLDDPRVIWSDKGGVYGEEEEVYVEDPENPEEGEWYYPITPAKYLYFGVRPTEETITISTAGMATFSSRFSLDFSEIEGMKAYVVSEFEPETKTLVMESVDEVPAQTGLLLKGTPGTYTVPVIDEAEYTCNLLVPITRDIILQPTETIDDEEYTNFVLTRYNGNVGFYRFDTPQSYSAGKAYLQIETSLVEKANDGSSEVTAFNMIFDDDATGMESLINLNNHQNNKIYNLSGQRLQKLQKGINIVNGKKMFVY